MLKIVDLLPCPKCGSADVGGRRTASGWQVKCDDCGHEGRECQHVGRAYRNWNCAAQEGIRDGG
jgi:hypothetical protein